MKKINQKILYPKIFADRIRGNLERVIWHAYQTNRSCLNFTLQNWGFFHSRPISIGKLIFDIFSVLFEQDLTHERAQAGLKAARSRECMDGRPPLLKPDQVKNMIKASGTFNIFNKIGTIKQRRGVFIRHNNYP